uniref:Chromo domain-containing protein n=2 Tax=Parascaris univalens TaxID=6257 RepID=A0A915AXR4_PARUN
MPMDAIQKEENVYAAEALLKDRKRKGKIEYLVKWKGWSAKHNSWEPRENILDERLFAEYEARKAKKNDRKRSSTSSSTKKSPQPKRSKRLSATEHKNESNDEDDTDDEEINTPVTSPSTSKSPKRKGAKGNNKEMEKEIGVKNSEKDSTEKRDEEDVPENGNTKEAEAESRDDKVEDDKLKESPKKSPGKPKDSPERKAETSTLEVVASTSTEESEKLKIPVASEGGTTEISEHKEVFEEKEQTKSKPIVEQPNKEPKVFHGHMTSIQIASSSNGQEQRVNMNAFVVSQPGASGSTEQLQICENEDLAKIQAIKNEIISETKNWTDAGNVRHESFQYNGSHTITEVTVNQQTVPIVEI